jgi:hypothetical protein
MTDKSSEKKLQRALNRAVRLAFTTKRVAALPKAAPPLTKEELDTIEQRVRQSN